jgi:lipoate-protein ligase A
MDTWRLLLHPTPARGAWNMAVDEAILEACGRCPELVEGRGDSLPTLRLYAWEPACLSLGYAQPIRDVDLERLHARGWDLVRRPTGGRAVLHVNELTYSVTGPLNEPRLAGTVLESYNRLAAALTEALRLLGLPVQVQEHSQSSSRTANPVCFEMPSTYEITVGGKKLVGSAQARRKAGVLQHGSLPLTGDLRRILQALVYPDEESRTRAAERLLRQATTVETALGRVVTWDEAAEAFVSAFRSVLDLDLQPASLTSQELSRAEELLSMKYACNDWTENKKS